MRRLLVSTSLAASVLLLSGCAATVYLEEGPPADRVEVLGVAPSPSYVWVAGHWAWDTTWVWVPGHWAKLPQENAVWVSGHWRKSPRGWVWIEGRWRY